MASNAKALSFLSGDLSLSGTEVSINVAGSVQSDSITGSTITMKNTGNTIVASDGSTAVLSESSGTVTIDADVSTIGSATISGGSITGTEIDLKSSGTTIFASDGTTAVLSESGGAVTLTADTAIIEGSSSGDLVRITQTGSGNALVVEDSANPDSTPVVVDTAGRLLVGSTTARSSNITPVLQTEGVGAIGNSAIGIFLNRDVNAAGPRFIFTRTRGTVAGSSVAVENNDSLGRIVWYGADGTDTDSIGGLIECFVDGTPGTNDMPGRLVFSTTANGADSQTERMRIDSSGNVGIGQEDPIRPLHIKTTSSEFIRLESGDGNNAAGYITAYKDASNRAWYLGNPSKANTLLTLKNDLGGGINLSGSGGSANILINSSGTIQMPDVYSDTVTGRDLYISSSGQLGYVSSIRSSKTNIENLPSISWLYELTPVKFQYRTKDEDGNYTDEADLEIQYGFIAEDVVEVNSDLVFGDETENGFELRGIQYSRLIAPMIKAIQEQQALIESQQSQIDTLTTKTQEQDLTIASLISRIEALENA